MFATKIAGKPYAGKPHVRIEEGESGVAIWLPSFSTLRFYGRRILRAESFTNEKFYERRTLRPAGFTTGEFYKRRILRPVGFATPTFIHNLKRKKISQPPTSPK